MPDLNPYLVQPRVLIFAFRDDKILLMEYVGPSFSLDQTQQERKDVYHCISGSVRKGEDIIEAAVNRANEEAGILLIDPKIRGIVNMNSFSGKSLVNFIVTGTTKTDGLSSKPEIEVKWIPIADLNHIHIFSEIIPVLQKLLSSERYEMFIGKAELDASYHMKSIQFHDV